MPRRLQGLSRYYWLYTLKGVAARRPVPTVQCGVPEKTNAIGSYGQTHAGIDWLYTLKGVAARRPVPTVQCGAPEKTRCLGVWDRVLGLIGSTL